MAAILYMMWRMPETPKYRPLAVCLMLVAAGAVGNMIDRMTQNYVVDFLYFRLIDFPVFNVADCYVTIAAAGLVLLVLFIMMMKIWTASSPERLMERRKRSETGNLCRRPGRRSAY